MTGNPDFSSVHAFIDELWRYGVRHVCISPGSRSTPVTISVASHGGFQIHTLLDERSGGFFALGLARRLQQPVLLICTSGTATANYHPAVMEAFQSRIPLLVLTADRPPELHHVGANQTVNQLHLFGASVKWFVQMPVPEDTEALRTQAAATAWRALGHAMAVPMGPVHINWPFREPLIPSPRTEAWDSAEAVHGGLTTLTLPVLEPTEEAVLTLQRVLAEASRPLIVVGPQENPDLAEAVAQLAGRFTAPVLADPLSQLRCSAVDSGAEWILDSYDWFVDAGFTRQAKPDLLLRFGRTPTSKGLSQYLSALKGAIQVICTDEPGWIDPSFSATHVIVCNPVRWIWRALSESSSVNRTKARWLTDWQRFNRTARDVAFELVIPRQSDKDQTKPKSGSEHSGLSEAGQELPIEGRLWLELSSFISHFKNLFVGNSMPVRDMDGFFQVTDVSVKVFANRGVSGIDGIVSSAAGTAAAHNEPTLLVIGDVSFYHDLNGLLAVASEQLPLCIVLVHNDGGGIFAGLPQAEVPETYRYFQTPHGLEFRSVIKTYGGQFHSVCTWEAFHQAMAATREQGGLSVVELRTSSLQSTAVRREIRRTVKRRLETETE